MPYAAFISKAGAGNATHNAREFNDDHPEPDYLLPAKHRFENIHITTDLTPAMVRQEYLETTDFGKKHGRLHHKAEPVREAVITCKRSTGAADVRHMMAELEAGLGIRSLYAHVHKDEGHVDEDTGKPKYNYHIHYGYTNLVIEKDDQGQRRGTLTHMNQSRMSKAQDIVARTLGMERGVRYAEREDLDKNPRHTSHQAFRAEKQAEAQARAEERATADQRVQAVETAAGARIQAAEAERDALKTEYEKLGALNNFIRTEMKAIGTAGKQDYQAWAAKLRDQELTYEEKKADGQQLLDGIRDRVTETEQAREAAITERDQERKRADGAEANVKSLTADLVRETKRADAAEEKPLMVGGITPFHMPRIKLPKPAGIMQRAGSYRETAQEHVNRSLQERKHAIQHIAEDHARLGVATELDDAQKKHRSDEARYKVLESKLETEQLTRQSVEIDLSNERQTNQDLSNQITVVTGEKEALKKNLSLWEKFFGPFLRLYNSLAKEKKEPQLWLEQAIKDAVKLAETFMQTPTETLRARYTPPAPEPGPKPARPQSDRDYGPGM